MKKASVKRRAAVKKRAPAEDTGGAEETEAPTTKKALVKKKLLARKMGPAAKKARADHKAFADKKVFAEKKSLAKRALTKKKVFVTRVRSDALAPLWVKFRKRVAVRRRATLTRITQWAWGSRQLTGGNLYPLADYCGVLCAERDPQGPLEKHRATCSYGIDASGRVVIQRDYDDAGEYTETITEYVENGWQSATYRSDGALLVVTTGVEQEGRLVVVRGRDRLKRHWTSRISYNATGFVKRIDVDDERTKLETYSFVPTWNRDGELEQLVEVAGSLRLETVLYQRKQ